MNTLKKKKVAVMYRKSDYCVGIKDAFTKNSEELGGEVVAEDKGLSATRATSGPRSQKVKAAQPELVYFVIIRKATWDSNR